MGDLDDVIANVRARITRYRGQSIGEQNTKNVLIEPVLRALGWDVEDLDEVRREFKRKGSDNPVDYVLFLLRTPRLFVEAKALGENLDDDRWAKQMMGYATVAGVEWVVLTDGNDYRIYNSHAVVPVEQKLFRRIVIGSGEPDAVATLSLLSKGRLQDNQIDVLWRADFVDRQVKAAIEGMLTPEPSTDLVRLIRKRTPALSPADLRASLGRVRLSVDYPTVHAPASSVVKAAPAPARAPARAATEPRRRTSAPGATLASLIASGAIAAPLDLHVRYRGRDLTARVERDGAITFDGVRYDSLSTAGGMARRSVVGTPAGREYPATNGWSFWRYRRADGSSGPIEELRSAPAGGNVVPLARRAGTRA